MVWVLPVSYTHLLIIGHMGEGLPYALARSSGILSHAAPHLRQPVADYFQSNIHCTTSGYFTLPPLRCALEVVGIDRLLFSIDYPYSPNTRGRDFLDSVPEILGENDIAKLTHRKMCIRDRYRTISLASSAGSCGSCCDEAC